MRFWEWIQKKISAFKKIEKNRNLKKKNEWGSPKKRREEGSRVWDPKWSEHRLKDKNRQYCGICNAEITCIYCNGWGVLDGSSDLPCRYCNKTGRRFYHKCRQKGDRTLHKKQ